MKHVIYNNIIPFRGFRAMALFPFIFARMCEKWLKDYVVNHEAIHLRQQREVFIVALICDLILIISFSLSWWWLLASAWVYLLLYSIFYLIFFIRYRENEKAYWANPFEAEARANQSDFNYLKDRKMFSWIKYIGKKI